MNSRQLASNTCFKWILSGRYLCLLYLWSSTTLSAIVELGREAGYFFGSARNFADPSADEVALIHYNTTSLDVAQSDTIWWSHGSASAKTRFLRSHILDLAFCGQKTYLLQKSLIFKITKICGCPLRFRVFFFPPPRILFWKSYQNGYLLSKKKNENSLALLVCYWANSVAT